MESASRVGLPSGPNSRKSSVLDLSQQQQQQLQQLQQLQLQQQQYLQQHLPLGVANADTSPPSEDEDRRYRPRWKGSGSQLPPQSPKQVLSRLKQAASVSNVAQDSSRQGQLLATSQMQQRKSSMFQLGDSQAPTPTTTTTLQRKGSMYVAKVTETPPLGTPTRKGSVYQRSGVGLGVDSPGPDSPQRKQSVVKTLSGSYVNMPALTGGESSYGLKLGPSQIHPKGYRLTTARYGELKMGFVKIKGNVEVELICARNIVNEDCETPPDTYVKCYIKDGDRLRHKKKTRVVRHAAEPLYRQTIKYQVSKWPLL
uniref:Regulating synaptic membrane exocytosis protein 2-like n=1 Tax=Drosophila rhopaloa TaxID=1041015 RepID=A0A6P4FPW0_DRORH